MRAAEMTLDVGEETQASHSRSIVPLRGGERFSQDIAHSYARPEADLRAFSWYHHLYRKSHAHAHALASFDSIPTENRAT